MRPYTEESIHWTKLAPASPDNALATEWETYRQEVGRLLAEGNEGRFVLIKGDNVGGVYDTWDEARQVSCERYLMQAVLIHQISEWEPLIRGPIWLHLWHSLRSQSSQTG